MGIYDKYVLPKVLHLACGLKPVMRQREKVVPLATGRVLEIGMGSGLNLPLYNPQKVECLWGLDPSAEMWLIAKKNAHQHRIHAEFIQSGAESIPLQDNSADTVMMTYTLCTIPDAQAALGEIKRVLKPGGKLIFCEHGKAPDKNVQRWQNRINPAWKKLAGGCNLNRSIAELLTHSGFKIHALQTMYLPGWRPATYNYWGTAGY